MSFQAMAWAVDQDLPVNQKMVLLMLANRTNHDTGRCDPSMDRLARDCGMSKSSVKNAIRALKNTGLIVAEERKAGTVNLPNQYRLKMSENTGVGQEVPQGGAGGAPGVGQEVPPKQELETGRETGKAAGCENLPGLEADPASILSSVAPPETAAEFVEHRREMKKPLTVRAAKAIVSKIKNHPDPGAVLTDSIANGWQGVFPDKTARPRREEESQNSYFEGGWL